MEVGNDYAYWHPDCLCGVFVALVARIKTDANRNALGSLCVANDAARIAAGAGAFAAGSAEASALASALAKNEFWCVAIWGEVTRGHVDDQT